MWLLTNSNNNEQIKIAIIRCCRRRRFYSFNFWSGCQCDRACAKFKQNQRTIHFQKSTHKRKNKRTRKKNALCACVCVRKAIKSWHRELESSTLQVSYHTIHSKQVFIVHYKPCYQVQRCTQRYGFGLSKQLHQVAEVNGGIDRQPASQIPNSMRGICCFWIRWAEVFETALALIGWISADVPHIHTHGYTYTHLVRIHTKTYTHTHTRNQPKYKIIKHLTKSIVNN